MSNPNQNNYSMMSRLSIMEQLKELKHYRFVAYHAKIKKGIHRVSLCVEDFRKHPMLRDSCIREFIVVEHVGFISATSVCGRIHIERLS